MDRRKTVVIGLLGPTLDAGQGIKRWERWRPSVAVCQQSDLIVDRFELLSQRRFASLAKTIRSDIEQVSPETQVREHEIEVDDAWNLEQVYGALHDFARGYAFDVEREDYLIHITTGTHIAQICMFLLTEAHYFPGRLLQVSPKGEHGSFTIIDLDLSSYDRLASRFRKETNEALSFLKSGIETKNEAFNRLIERIERVATTSPEPLLLHGTTGSGKSRLAQRIFQLKKSRQQLQGDFVEVNCATLRGDSAMSALFGHSKGAFTGAVEARAGLLRKAHKGVLFLDEIGELGADEQAMLLRAIEEKVFYPVGSDKEVSSEFQLIAGTNRNLQDAVSAGLFRDDLLARINLWTFTLPSLRERSEDIEPNLDYELERAGAVLKQRFTFTREARERFLRFARSPETEWRANFRDFAAAVRRMTTLAEGGRIGLREVDEEIARLTSSWRSASLPLAQVQTPTAFTARQSLVDATLGAQARQLDPFDRVQLEEVLRVCREKRSMSEAGRHLFAATLAQKTTKNDADRLRKYLKRFGLDWKRASEPMG